MASFSKDNTTRTPFGKNAYLRSTQDVKVESYTLSADAFPANVEVDGVDVKILQPGTVIAMITSGAEAGKVGVYDATAGVLITDGRQTEANIIGIADTFVPTQLAHRDVDIGVVYEATVVEDWCLEHLDGVQQAMSAATKAAVISAVPTIHFK